MTRCRTWGLSDQTLPVSCSGGQAPQWPRRACSGCAAPGAPWLMCVQTPLFTSHPGLGATLLQCEGLLMHSAHKPIPEALGLGFPAQLSRRQAKSVVSPHASFQRPALRSCDSGAGHLARSSALASAEFTAKRPHAWLFLAVSDLGSIRAEVLPPWSPTPPPRPQALPNPRSVITT